MEAALQQLGRCDLMTYNVLNDLRKSDTLVSLIVSRPIRKIFQMLKTSLS